MSCPFISLRAIKIINLIITTVWSYDMSHVGDVMTSFIITSLWVIITYLLDFFFINSISLFFYFFEFLFWMWRSKEKMSLLSLESFLETPTHLILLSLRLLSRPIKIEYFVMGATLDEWEESEKKKLKISRRKKLWLI